MPLRPSSPPRHKPNPSYAKPPRRKPAEKGGKEGAETPKGVAWNPRNSQRHWQRQLQHRPGCSAQAAASEMEPKVADR
nr:unnamed protein product [Digitaria exilis]